MSKNEKFVFQDAPSKSADDSSVKKFSQEETFRLPTRFKYLNHLITRDLNHRWEETKFKKYSKEEILKFLKDPYTYEKPLRDACINVYAFSPHFRRLIQYLTMLNDFAYVVSPNGINVTKANQKTVKRNFDKVLRCMEGFQVKSQLPKILTVCLREDVFYGTLWVTSDNVTIQRLPSDYCKIASITGNVFNVSFDFSYFTARPWELQYFPEEFAIKYEIHKSDPTNMRWIELDSPTSFAVKCTSDINAYPIPPFVGILPEIYDLEDYKSLKLTHTELENYAILVMKLGMDNNRNWDMDFDTARDFWRNLDSVLPDAVGSVLSPMPVEKISFDKSNSAEANAVEDATSALFSAAGVSSLLFNSNKSSSNALLLSVKADQGMVYGIVKNIEDVINRYIQSTNFGKYFKVTFLDISPFNRDEVGGQYLKMCQVGMPMVSYLAAAYGMPQSDMSNMNFLEDDILGIKERFMPLRSTNTMSASESEGVGRPESGLGEISDNGEIAKEQDEE